MDADLNFQTTFSEWQNARGTVAMVRREDMREARMQNVRDELAQRYHKDRVVKQKKKKKKAAWERYQLSRAARAKKVEPPPREFVPLNVTSKLGVEAALEFTAKVPRLVDMAEHPTWHPGPIEKAKVGIGFAGRRAPTLYSLEPEPPPPPPSWGAKQGPGEYWHDPSIDDAARLVSPDYTPLEPDLPPVKLPDKREMQRRLKIAQAKRDRAKIMRVNSGDVSVVEDAPSVAPSDAPSRLSTVEELSDGGETKEGDGEGDDKDGEAGDGDAGTGAGGGAGATTRPPPEWRKVEPKKGPAYYYNTRTRRTSVHSHAGDPQDEQCPWRIARDPKDKVYYWHVKTREVTWDKPDDYVEIVSTAEKEAAEMKKKQEEAEAAEEEKRKAEAEAVAVAAAAAAATTVAGEENVEETKNDVEEGKPLNEGNEGARKDGAAPGDLQPGQLPTEPDKAPLVPADTSAEPTHTEVVALGQSQPPSPEPTPAASTGGPGTSTVTSSPSRPSSLSSSPSSVSSSVSSHSSDLRSTPEPVESEPEPEPTPEFPPVWTAGMELPVATRNLTVLPHRKPTGFRCPNCDFEGATKVYHRPGRTFSALCVMLCLSCCFVPCILLPFCNRAKDTVHKCPNCKVKLGRVPPWGQNVFIEADANVSAV